MQLARIRERSWRFYINWLAFMLMWVILILIAFSALRGIFPLYLYVFLAYPVHVVFSSIYHSYKITHPGGRFAMRNITPADAGLEYDIVEFPSRDGLSLFGWFIPGTNGATVILIHGHGGKGISMIYHASAIVAKGFSVLMFDLRAHGSSDGDTCTSGWLEVNDVLGALDYVQSRNDVDPNKIGVLGISLGAKAAIRAVTQTKAIQAVVVEGLGPMTLEDHGDAYFSSLKGWFYFPYSWLYYKILNFMSGVKPTTGILSQIEKITSRPLLLISTGKKGEQRFGRICCTSASESFSLWEVEDANHAEAYFQDPEAYQKQVCDFFNEAMLSYGEK